MSQCVALLVHRRPPSTSDELQSMPETGLIVGRESSDLLVPESGRLLSGQDQPIFLPDLRGVKILTAARGRGNALLILLVLECTMGEIVDEAFSWTLHGRQPSQRLPRS